MIMEGIRRKRKVMSHGPQVEQKQMEQVQVDGNRIQVVGAGIEWDQVQVFLSQADAKSEQISP